MTTKMMLGGVLNEGRPTRRNLMSSSSVARRSSRCSHALHSLSAIAANLLRQVNVVVVERFTVDPLPRRGEPGRDLALLGHWLHERADVGLIDCVGQPGALLALPPLDRDTLSA